MVTNYYKSSSLIATKSEAGMPQMHITYFQKFIKIPLPQVRLEEIR